MQVKIQKTPNGKLLCSAIVLSAEIMEPYKDLEYVELHPTIDDDGHLNLSISNSPAHSIPVQLINPIMEALTCK